MDWILLVFVVIGSVIYLGFSLNEIYGKPEFKWSIFLKQNWLSSALNVLCGITLVLLKDEIAQWLPMTKLVAVFVGFSGQGILKRIFKMLDSRVDTFIGVNNGK